MDEKKLLLKTVTVDSRKNQKVCSLRSNCRDPRWCPWEASLDPATWGVGCVCVCVCKHAHAPVPPNRAGEGDP